MKKYVNPYLNTKINTSIFKYVNFKCISNYLPALFILVTITC